MKRHRLQRAMAACLLGLLVLVPDELPATSVPQPGAAARKTPRRRLHPPRNIVLRSRPVTVRLDIPPEIQERIRTPEGQDVTYIIHFHGIEVPAYDGTLIRGFAGWRAYLWDNSPAERLFGTTSTMVRPEPTRDDSIMGASGWQLRRFAGQRTYLPFTIAQVDLGGIGPRRGLTVRIACIHLVPPSLPDKDDDCSPPAPAAASPAPQR